MKPIYRPREKRGLPEQRGTANKDRTGWKQPGEGVSSAPAGPNPTPDLSKQFLRRSSYLPARKKIQLPVIPFWKGAPYPRPLVKYTSALPLRRARLRRKAPHPLSTGRDRLAKPEVARPRATPRLKSAQIGTSQKPPAAQDRRGGTSRSLQPRPGPAPRTPGSPQPSGVPQQGGRAVDRASPTKASKTVRSLQLGSPDSASNSSPSPPPSPSALQRRRPRHLSRRYLQQMEWYRALRKEKKLRDARKRLDELCGKVTLQRAGGSLKKGLLGASAVLEPKGRGNRTLTPAYAGLSAELRGALGGSEHKDPFTKKRKLSPQSSGGVPLPHACRKKRPARRSWKLDSSSSCASPLSDTRGAITPAQTPAPTSVSTPTDSTFVPLAPASAHFKADPMAFATGHAEPFHTDTNLALCSSADSQTHTATVACATALNKNSNSSAPAAGNSAALAKESHSDLAPPTVLAPPTHWVLPTDSAEPTGSIPACGDCLPSMHLSIETSSPKSPTPPVRNQAITGGLSESKKAAERCEHLENTDTKCNGATAALHNCNPAPNSSKMAYSQPAEKGKETNTRPKDKAKTASDIERLTAVKNDRSHLDSITGKPETGSPFSAGRKCLLSRSAATNRAPPGLKTSQGWQSPDFQSDFLNKPDKIEISPVVSRPSSKQHSSPADKKSLRPMKSARSSTSALSCKPSKPKSRSVVQAASSKADEPGKNSPSHGRTPDTNPASKNCLGTLTKKASLSSIAAGPSRGVFLKDTAVARVSPAVTALGYRTSPTTKTRSSSLNCKVCPVCQCSPLPESAVPSAGRRDVTSGLARTPRRNSKPKRGPPLHDRSAVTTPLFSVLPAHKTPAKHLSTPRPKLRARRGSEAGRCSVEATPHHDARPCQKLRLAASDDPHSAVRQGPSRRTSVSPRLSSPSTVRSPASLDSRPGRRNSAVVRAAEPQSLTSITALPGHRGRRGGLGLTDGSFSSAFATPETPVPADNTRLSPACHSDSVVRRDTPCVKKTKKSHVPKATPRKTLSGGDHRRSTQKSCQHSTGADQARIWNNTTATPRIRSQKGAPHSTDHACRSLTNHTLGSGSVPSDPAVGEEGTGREGWASPPASPELIDTLVRVMSSLLGLDPPLPGSLPRQPYRNTHTDQQEESCPARNLGFLMRLKAKRQRLQELSRRVERLTAELQEASLELEREMTECRRAGRDQREDRGDEIEEAKDERERAREGGGASGQEGFE